MRTLLIPTDFSENAGNALYYAIELAKRESAKIILIHAFTIDYVNVFSPESELAETKRQSDNELQKLSIRIAHAEGIDFEYESIEGSAVKAILNSIKDRVIDLVIMGTKGESNFANVIFGSTTSKVIAKADCPVIAVPEGASFEPIKKITYATDYKLGDIFALKKVLEIAKPYHAQINVLHISSEAESALTERTLMEKFMKKVTSQIDYFNLSFQMLHGDKVEEELWNYINSGSADLIVMSTHHYTLFERAFGKSVTNKIADRTVIPLMVFHFNKKLSAMLF